MELDGAVAIVTGGASGIGEATVRDLAGRGVLCVVADRDEERGRAIADKTAAVFVRTDVAVEAEVENAVKEAAGRGPLRLLVNAAGVGSAGRTLDRGGEPLPLRRYTKVVEINLIGSFNFCRLAAAVMAKLDPIGPDGIRGAIINIASVAAFEGQIGQAAYAAAKGGIVSMTLPLARDLASAGIRVNTIAPGLIDTPIYGSGEQADEFKAALARNVLLPRRLGRVGELASMIIEVATNDYVNGETIRVDGGIRLPPK